MLYKREYMNIKPLNLSIRIQMVLSLILIIETKTVTISLFLDNENIETISTNNDHYLFKVSKSETTM